MPERVRLAPSAEDVRHRLADQGPVTERELEDVSEYRYDAFISYRHVEPDRRWAKWLHTALETYRVPKSAVRDRRMALRISRAFRDEEELPASANLSKEIETALQQSRFLIVVCSPRTPQSDWVNKEAERFREMGRGDQILALLIEGEPGESFPRALREIRHAVAREGGITREEIEEVEPLAADVRPTRSEATRYLKRMAKLRMLACILACPFDLLRQRDRERRRRRITLLGAAAAAAILIAAASAFYARSRIAAERSRVIAAERTIEEQKRLTSRQAEAERLAREEAQKARKDAERVRAEADAVLAPDKRTKHSIYCGALKSAYVAYGEANRGRLESLLAACAPDLRGWEWYLLWNRRDQSFLTIRQEGKVSSLALSGDGRYLAIGRQGSLQFWNVRENRQHKVIPAGSGMSRPHYTGFSPDGASLVVSWLPETPEAYEDKGKDQVLSVKVYEVESGNETLSIAPGELIETVAYSADSKYIVGVANRYIDGSHRPLSAWDARSGEPLPLINLRPGPRGDNDLPAFGVYKRVGAYWVTPDGRFAAYPESAFRSLDTAVLDRVSLRYAAYVFDLRHPNRPPCLLNAPGHAVAYVALTPDGATAVSGGSDCALRLWDAETGKQLCAARGHAAQVEHVDVSDTGEIVASADVDTVKVWNVTRLLGDRDFVRIEPKSTSKPTYDVQTRARMSVATGTEQPYVSNSSPDGKKVVLQYYGPDQTVKDAVLYSVDADRVIAKFQWIWQADGMTRFSQSAFSEDARLLFVGPRYGGPVEVIDTASGAVVHSYQCGPQDVIYYVAGRFVLISAPSPRNAKSEPFVQTVKAFQPATGALQCEFEVAGSDDLAFPSAAAKSIASMPTISGEPRQYCVYDIDARRIAAPLQDSGSIASPWAFSPDGTYFAAVAPPVGLTDNPYGGLRVWTTQDGAAVASFEVPNRPSAMAFSPDNKRLVTGDIDGTVTFWDCEAGQEVLSLASPRGAVKTLAFAPDGRELYINGIYVLDSGPQEAADVAPIESGTDVFQE